MISKNNSSILIPTILFFIALGLRLWGNSFGLPYEYHPDEVQYVRQAASMGSRGFEPTWWNNPPFYKYILFGEFGVFYVLGRIFQWFTSISEFGAINSLDPTNLYLISRSTTAVFGALTVLLVFWIGSAAYENKVIGSISSFFLAVSFLHVRDSHFAVNDIPAAFFTTFALLASFMIWKAGDRKWYIVGGIAVGLGFATKYTAIFGIIPLIVAHAFRCRARKINCVSSDFVLLCVCLPLAAILASPYFLLTPGKVFQDIYQSLYLAGQGGFDGWVIDTAGGYLFYLTTLFRGMGWGLAVLTIFSTFMAFVWKSNVNWIMLSAIIPLYLFMGYQKMYFARFLIPVFPPLFLLGAWFLIQILKGMGGKPGKVWLLFLTLLLSFETIASAVRFDNLLTQEDTRTMAKNWIESNLPEGSKIALDWPFYCPQLSNTNRQIPKSERLYESFDVGGFGLSDNSVEWYQANGIRYIVTTSFISQLELEDDLKNLTRKEFYKRIAADFHLIKTISPGKSGENIPFIFDELYGPIVSIWHRDFMGPMIEIYEVQSP